MSSAKEMSDLFRKEAKERLCLLLNGHSVNVDRCVDCIIEAAVMEVAYLTREAVHKATQKEEHHGRD